MNRWRQTFELDEDRVQCVSGRLEGMAAEWVVSLHDLNDPALQNYDDFINALRERFVDPFLHDRTAAQIRLLKQGNKSVEDYAREFQMLASRLHDWSEVSKIDCFKDGLNPDVLEKTLTQQNPTTLKDWIALAGQMEYRMMQVKIVRQRQSLVTAKRPTRPDTSNTLSEKEKWRKLGLCLNCGGKGHFASNCSSKWGEKKGSTGYSGIEVVPGLKPRQSTPTVPPPKSMMRKSLPARTPARGKSLRSESSDRDYKQSASQVEWETVPYTVEFPDQGEEQDPSDQ